MVCFLCKKNNFQLVYKLKSKNILHCRNDGLFLAETTVASKNNLYQKKYFDNLPHPPKSNQSYFLKKLAAIKRLTRNESPHILDVGCGWGGFEEVLEKGKIPYLGIDASKEAVEICRKKELNCKQSTIEQLIKSITNKHNDSGVVVPQSGTPPQNDVILATPNSFRGRPESISSLTLLLFSANLSLFASVYYVGRSHPHNLFHISTFFILNVFLLINQFLKNEFAKKISKKITFTFYFLLFTSFILFPAFNRKQALASLIKTKFDRLKNTSIFKPELEKQIKQYYFSESLLIRNNLPETEILILSVDDTFLFYLIDKKNLISDNPQSGIASQTDLNLVLKKAYKICPQKIAADCSLFGVCPKYQTFNHEAVNIQKILLESLEKGCKVKYKPIKCTNKLCIATP